MGMVRSPPSHADHRPQPPARSHLGPAGTARHCRRYPQGRAEPAGLWVGHPDEQRAGRERLGWRKVLLLRLMLCEEPRREAGSHRWDLLQDLPGGGWDDPRGTRVQSLCGQEGSSGDRARHREAPVQPCVAVGVPSAARGLAHPALLAGCHWNSSLGLLVTAWDPPHTPKKKKKTLRGSGDVVMGCAHTLGNTRVRAGPPRTTREPPNIHKS